MSSSLPRFANLSAVVIALAWTAVSFGAVLAPASAQAGDHKIFYTAELAQPASEGRTVAGGIVWSCKGTTCVAGKGTSRPLRICRELQREMGEITAFTAKGKQLDEARLARCNG